MKQKAGMLGFPDGYKDREAIKAEHVSAIAFQLTTSRAENPSMTIDECVYCVCA